MKFLWHNFFVLKFKKIVSKTFQQLLESITSRFINVNICTFPGLEAIKSFALYWSPWAWRPIMMGCSQPGTNFGIFLHTIGSLNTVPPSTFLIVPLGDNHIFFRLNSGKGRIIRKIYFTKKYILFTFNSGLIRCNCCTLDTNIVLQNGVGCINSYLIVGSISEKKNSIKLSESSIDIINLNTLYWKMVTCRGDPNHNRDIQL